ncbi:rRNA N-glycosidase [Hordeum vulgare]|nr:rRNA N-glycosidase [Hordeum vulgare]
MGSVDDDRSTASPFKKDRDRGHDRSCALMWAGGRSASEPASATPSRRACAPSPPQVRGHTHVRGLTPTLSPSPSPPPPPPITDDVEPELIRHVMKDSMNTHDERQLPGLETHLALSVAGDVAILQFEMAIKEEVREEELIKEPP